MRDLGGLEIYFDIGAQGGDEAIQGFGCQWWGGEGEA